MRKWEEMWKPESCMNRAADDEMTFVLLGRDAAAPSVIRFWAGERVRRGTNEWSDAQIVEALECANRMESERKRG